MMNHQEKTLRACFLLHDQLLTNCCYQGYEGDKNAFDRLFAEVHIIARDELPDDADCEQIVETFHDYQLEIMNGYRDADWYC